MKFRYVLVAATVFVGTLVAAFFMLQAQKVPAPQHYEQKFVSTAAGAAQALANQPATTTTPLPLTQGPNTFLYVEVVDSCGPYYNGTCVNMRSGPGPTYPSVLKLRDGIVLKVIGDEYVDGKLWYKLDPGSDIRYPERKTTDWYVQADLVKPFYHLGEEPYTASTTDKHIIVNLSKQMLYAYDGVNLFLEDHVSTGLQSTETPVGNFHVFRKTPSRYMQGPLPGISDQYYDLPGVPWDLYFTYDGGAIHGAYWHDHFGEPWSHGCVNLPLNTARVLYEWAPIGTPVTVVP